MTLKLGIRRSSRPQFLTCSASIPITPRTRETKTQTSSSLCSHTSGQSQIESIYHYKLPAGARNCKLSQRIPEVWEDRIFFTWVRRDANGVGSVVHQILEVKGNVAWNSMQEVFDSVRDTNHTIRQRNWANWHYSKTSLTPYRRGEGKEIECAEDLSFREQAELSLEDDAFISLTSSNTTGRYIGFGL